MSLEQKIEQARREQAQKQAQKEPSQDIKRSKQGKFRGLTWRERFGAFRLLWIFFWGVFAGSSWTYVVLEMPEYFTSESRTIIINNVEAKTEEVEETKEVSKMDKVAELADMVYNLESTRGKNNYSKCEEIGKVNGIGYGIPGNGTYQCFDSHEEEMKVLEGWIIDKMSKGMTENEMLCLYSGNNYQICK